MECTYTHDDHLTITTVRYIKHNVFWRLKKLTDIMVNKTSMRKFPVAFEYAPDISEVQH